MKMFLSNRFRFIISILWDILHLLMLECCLLHDFIQQDVLFVVINNYFLKIDVAKLRSTAPSGVFSENDHVKCDIDSLAEGVYCIGKHDGEVTDLSIYNWGMTYLASVSKDGMVGKLVFIFIISCLFHGFKVH